MATIDLSWTGLENQDVAVRLVAWLLPRVPTHLDPLGVAVGDEPLEGRELGLPNPSF